MLKAQSTAEFIEWFSELSTRDAATVTQVVLILESVGITLGAPHSSAIVGSKHALRELRPKQGRSPIRIFYAFDPLRNAVLLIGGDKAGNPKFYKRMILVAERIWEEHIESLKEPKE